MAVEKEEEKLFSDLQARGFAGRMVSIARLRELEEEINDRYQKGMFDQEFYQDRLMRFEFSIPPAELPEAKSILIAAMPSTEAGAVFHWNGETKTLIMPPTYVGYYGLPAKVEAEINKFLAPTGYRVAKTMRIPLKLLAVRSGLAEYGRNNITYIPGLGSFHHLFALFSNIPCTQDGWRGEKMLGRCKDCRACVIKCPTGAIVEDRFLIHAVRCLVFHNEKPGDVPFAAWIDPTSHNSLIGCMICQRYCPENRGIKDGIKIMAEFSHEETALLFQDFMRDALTPGQAQGDTALNTSLLPAMTLEKLELLGLADSLGILRRNLGVLLNTKNG